MYDQKHENEQYRYQLIAQDFLPGNAKCLLSIRDKLTDKTIRMTADIIFNDSDFIKQLEHDDVKMIGYIHGCESR